MDELFAYYAKLGAAFLHGTGAAGTISLIDKMNLLGTEKVLEIGCGTGATLAALARQYPGLWLEGVDRSMEMCLEAKKRLRRSGFSAVGITKVLPLQVYPFEDELFDVVYAESVLAIQDKASLLFILGEIKRLLRPGGVLLLNETIWRPETPKAEMDRFNALCMEHIGIIQASTDYPDQEAWMLLLADFDMKTLSCEVADAVPVAIPSGWQGVWSKLFSLAGRVKGVLPGRHSQVRKRMRILEEIVAENKTPPLMQATLMVAQKMDLHDETSSAA